MKLAGMTDENVQDDVPQSQRGPARGRVRFAVWAGVAVLAVGLASAAVAATRGGDDNVLSRDDVANALASATAGGGSSASAVPQDGEDASMPRSPGPERRVVAGGGDMLVVCFEDLAALAAWTPAAGYRAVDVERGPGRMISIRFVSDVDDDFIVRVHCEDGEVHGEQQVQPDGGR